VHRIKEAVPFTVTEPKRAQLDAQRLNQAYETLLRTFPSLYSLLIVKDAQLVFERYARVSASCIWRTASGTASDSSLPDGSTNPFKRHIGD